MLFSFIFLKYYLLKTLSEKNFKSGRGVCFLFVKFCMDLPLTEFWKILIWNFKLNEEKDKLIGPIGLKVINLVWPPSQVVATNWHK